MQPPLPPEWDSWRDEAERLVAVPPLRRSEQTTRGPDDPKFALGDFLANVPPEYVEPLAEAVGQEPAKFLSYREVAVAIPPEQRVRASWSVHRNLRSRPDVLCDGLTVRKAHRLVGGKPFDSKPVPGMPVEERAEIVREQLRDPQVYDLIEREMTTSRAERKIRSRARQVVSEHAARQRELEQELRAMRQAKSPFEATVKTELELNRATQLVHAIGQTLDDLPQPARIIAALNDLSVEIAAVLMARRNPADHPEAPIIIDGEVWQDQPARAALASSNQEDLSGEGRAVIDLVDDSPP